MPTWRITFDGTGQAIGDRLDETLYVAGADDILSGFTAIENTGTGGLIKLDKYFPAHGLRNLRVQTTASASCYVQMTEDGTWGLTRWYSTYVYIPATSPIPANWDVIQVREAATLFRCRVDTTRTVSNILGSIVVGSPSTTVLQYNTPYRLVFKNFYSATVGILETKIYLGASATPLETVTASGIVTGTTLGTNTRVGIPIALNIAGPYYLDDIRATDVAEPFPTLGARFSEPGKVRRWNGSAWVTNNKIKRWTGSAWETVKIQPYD